MSSSELQRLLAQLLVLVRNPRVQRLSMIVATLVTASVVALSISTLFDLGGYYVNVQPSSSYRSQFATKVDSYVEAFYGTPGFENGLEIIFNSLDRESGGRLAQYGFAALLEDYIAGLMGDRDAENDQYVSGLITALENEKAEEPYGKLPAEARHLFTNADSAITNGDTSTALANLGDIALEMQVTHQLVTALRSRNTLMLGLAVAGLVFTVVLGTASLVGSFRRRAQKLRKGAMDGQPS